MKIKLLSIAISILIICNIFIVSANENQKESINESSNEDNVEIRVAIYTDEEENDEFYNEPWERTRYFMWALSDYCWSVGNKRYFLNPVLLNTDSLLNGELNTNNFDMLIIPADTINNNVFKMGTKFLPVNKKISNRIWDYILNGGGYYGECASAQAAGHYLNEPLTFFDRLWKNCCLGFSCTYTDFHHAIPIFGQLAGHNISLVGQQGYMEYSSWNAFDKDLILHNGVCLDAQINHNNPIFDDYLESTRKIRWNSGTALLIPDNPDRNISILAKYPKEEISDNKSTLIHHWEYTGGIKGLIKGMIRPVENKYYESFGIISKAYACAEDWEMRGILETNLSNKPFMTTEIYPNENTARIVLDAGHTSYNIWWGGHIEEVDKENNNLYDGLHRWIDYITEEETPEDEFSYNYWIIRRCIAWAAKVPDNELPPVYGPSQVCDFEDIISSSVFTIEGCSETADGITSLDLYYRYSDDNINWSNWTLFDTDTDESDGWSWQFKSPNGTGLYQFYSIRNVEYQEYTETETIPTGADATVYVEVN